MALIRCKARLDDSLCRNPRCLRKHPLLNSKTLAVKTRVCRSSLRLGIHCNMCHLIVRSQGERTYLLLNGWRRHPPPSIWLTRRMRLFLRMSADPQVRH